MAARTPKPKVCPFQIVTDTREQAPFPFQSIDGFDVIPVKFAALRTGDYSIAGMESRVSIERKSVADFYHSIGSDRERFEREMVRLAEMEFAAVVIEGMVRDKPPIVRMAVTSASHTNFKWRIKYGVHFIECLQGRREAELTTFHLLRHFWNYQQEQLKERELLLASALTGVC